jgi:pimeloyl-ACP methyl ester carboxylesterase
MQPSQYHLRRVGAQDGLVLAYRDYPGPPDGGMPAVCLTGTSRNAKDFDHVAARLATNRRVVCPDYRGRGRSEYDTDWRNYHPAVYLRDLHHVLAASGIHAAVFIGTSLGGVLAMAMGVLAPTVLRGAVLNDIGPDIEFGGRERIAELIGFDRPQPDWPQAVALCRQLYTQLGERDEERWRRFAKATFRRGEDGLLHFDWDTRIAQAVALQGEPPDLWAMFRSLRHIPVLSVRGELSDIFRAETQARMQREHPDMSCITVEGVGHAPFLEEPEVETAIDDLFRRVDRH